MNKENIMCDVCKSTENVIFVQIANCYLCEKCDDKLNDSFEEVMKKDWRFEKDIVH